MPQQTDLFERAAGCERACQATTDEQRQMALRILRDLWTALANQSPYLSEAQVAKEIAAIEQLHVAALESIRTMAE